MISKYSINLRFHKDLLKSLFFKSKHVRNCSSNINPSRQESLSYIKENLKIQRQNSVLYGQPTPITHPHILREKEIIKGIKLDEIKTRRHNLLELVQKRSSNHLDKNIKNHLVVIPSSTKKYMSDKIPYVFRQNSDFLYFSGCLEPDSVLVLEIDENNNAKSVMFLRPKDRKAELWDGPRTGVENALNFFGVDESYAVSELSNYLNRYTSSKKSHVIWYDDAISNLPDVSKAVHQVSQHNVKAPTMFMHKLRLIKSNAEIELMRETCQIASDSINEIISECRPGISEHHIFAKVDYYCRMKNASFLAYPPVVAGGSNGTVIHYINNSQIVNDGELVLMDAGCELGGYSSDITRTWPINGQFSDAQRVLYEVLSTVQSELLITLQNVGGENLDQLFDTMCYKIGRYLQEVGLIEKRLSNVELARAAYKFCPHHVSHYLGMDVHDTPLISRSISLVPGMVCTVEPGIYIGTDRKDVPQEFRGIGMRIEDDVLITPNNNFEVLTESCVKNLHDIEKLMKKQ